MKIEVLSWVTLCIALRMFCGRKYCCRVKGRTGLKVLEQGMEGVEDMAGVGNMMAAVLGMMVEVLAIAVNTTVVAGGLVVEVMCMTLLAEIQAPTPTTCECS